ncbi:MAG: sec-independent protein translocase TatC [Bacteroidetes bacterium]|nr:MAG: sec-independent protein translocase TatC [Bacteroidota bacterium]
MTRTPIQNRKDIELLVDEFYKKVRQDDVIGPIFNEVADINWDKHMPVMYSFWESALLDVMTYKGNAMTPHIALSKKTAITEEHFTRWKKLFFETLDEHFVGEKVEEAKKRADSMAILMQYKIEQSKSSNFIQ